jgi:hypothetical protein
MGMGLPEKLDAPPSGPFRRVPQGLPLGDGFPASGLRWLDASSLWWLNAARQAAGESGPVVDGAMVVGLGWGSNPPVIALIEQVYNEGFSAMAPAQFPFSVGNAPAAQAGILLGMKGAALTLCAKEAAGLAALVEAGRCMESGLFRTCIAGAVDSTDPFLLRLVGALRRGSGAPAGEGAYALRLDLAEAPPDDALARVACWASRSVPCPPHLFPEADPIVGQVLDRLLDRARWEAGSVDLAALPGDTGPLRSASAALLQARLPRAAPLPFQPTLGACGASWAGAAAVASRQIAHGKARRAVLVGLATGGCAWGLALESVRAQ